MVFAMTVSLSVSRAALRLVRTCGRYCGEACPWLRRNPVVCTLLGIRVRTLMGTCGKSDNETDWISEILYLCVPVGMTLATPPSWQGRCASPERMGICRRECPDDYDGWPCSDVGGALVAQPPTRIATGVLSHWASEVLAAKVYDDRPAELPRRIVGGRP